MRVKKGVVKKVKLKYSFARFAGASPVLELALYSRLLVTVGRVFKLKTLDVRILMLIGVCPGRNTSQLLTLAGMHPNSSYYVLDRLESAGYVFSTLPPERGRRPLYLTELGKEVQHEVNRLWLDVVRSANAGV